MPAANITLRPVTEADQDLVLAAYASTRAAEMAMVPWSAEQKEAFIKMQFAAQAEHYAAEFPRASHDVICRDGAPVGRLYLDRRDQQLHILDVTILPQFRNAGIGTFVLRRLFDEAAAGGKAVTIYIESFNPSLALFRKLGFHTAAEDGFQLLLRWTPSV